MDNQDTNSGQIVDEAKTVDEAIQKGLERLEISRANAEIEILEEGTRGVFNFIGAKQAKVVVRKKGDLSGVSGKIDELVTRLMDLMGVSCQIRVTVEDEVHRVHVDTAGADGLLIGKKGQNLEALEHLLRRMVGKQLKRSVRMDVDVGGYKERRIATLRSRAVSMAARVKSNGKEMQVEPLNAAERRIIHLALVSDPQVKTYTIGEGDLKTVVIAPQHRNARTG